MDSALPMCLGDGSWSICAPAKLNLGLRVFDLRGDGFHPLETWMVATSWHDTLTYRPGGPMRLEITGRSEGVPVEMEKNLVGRAAARLAREIEIQGSGVIRLHKVLPPGGGLGGGSSDAANALVLLNEAWRAMGCAGGVGKDRLLAIAAELGSDVPFFVEGGRTGGSLCKGRGEIMTPLRAVHPIYAVLILPDQGMPTGPVFAAFDAGHRHTGLPPTDWARQWQMTAPELNEVLINDLEPAAFSIGPWLADIRAEAAKIAAQKVHMTGSGSTLFTLCASAARAAEMADRIGSGLAGRAFCLPVGILRDGESHA